MKTTTTITLICLSIASNLLLFAFMGVEIGSIALPFFGLMATMLGIHLHDIQSAQAQNPNRL